MNDLISRQAAIDAMCELMHHWFGGDPKDEIREIKRELEKLPPAQSTPCAYWDRESNFCALHRPSGQPESAQWVQMFINPNLYKCSNCQVAWNKRFVFDNEGYSENIFMKYCPCCGRKMKTKVDYE